MSDPHGLSFEAWCRTNPDECVGPGVNYAWNRYMDSLAPPPLRAERQRYIMDGATGAFKTVTHVTPAPPESADTLTTGEQYRTPSEGKQMFTINKTDYVVFFVLLFALVAAVVG